MVANAFVAFVRLAERDKVDLAYPTPLAQYAIRQVRAGRRVGSKLNVRDVSSRYAQRVKSFAVEQLGEFDDQQGVWREALIEDRQAGPAETAAARIDVADWFKSLGRNKRKIAKSLARGEATSTVARLFGLTAGRVSQLRQELKTLLGFVSEPSGRGLVDRLTPSEIPADSPCFIFHSGLFYGHAYLDRNCGHRRLAIGPRSILSVVITGTVPTTAAAGVVAVGFASLILRQTLKIIRPLGSNPASPFGRWAEGAGGMGVSSLIPGQ